MQFTRHHVTSWGVHTNRYILKFHKNTFTVAKIVTYYWVHLAISTPYSSVHTHTHTHPHTHTHTPTHTHTHAPTPTHMNMYTHMYPPPSIHTHTYKTIYTHIQTCLNKHCTHTCTCYQYTVYHAQTSLPVSSHNLVAVEQFAARLSADRRNVRRKHNR